MGYQSFQLAGCNDDAAFADPERFPKFASLAEATTAAAFLAIKNALNTYYAEVAAILGHCSIAYPVNITTYTDFTTYISYGDGVSYYINYQQTLTRVQRYSVKITNSPQPLCSLKETAFTKISGFRKYTL